MNYMQKRINQIQAKYDEWRALLPELQADLARFERASKLIHDLEQFSTHEFLEFYTAIEQGASVNLQTSGEESVMSEDAIWNAYGDFQQLAWARLKASADSLDPTSRQEQNNQQNQQQGQGQ